MAKHGKKYTDATRRFDRTQMHTSPEAVDVVKNLASAKFDETVELAVRLGVDPRKADQMVRGTVALPSGTGKDVRVAVFAAGEAAQAARDAGAEFVGTDDVGARGFGFARLVAGREHCDAHGLAGAVGQRDGAADHLVGLAGVDAETERRLHGLVELRGGQRLHEVEGLDRVVELLTVEPLAGIRVLLAVLGHAALPSSFLE